jgi:hypothetical protein
LETGERGEALVRPSADAIERRRLGKEFSA